MTDPYLARSDILQRMHAASMRMSPGEKAEMRRIATGEAANDLGPRSAVLDVVRKQIIASCQLPETERVAVQRALQAAIRDLWSVPADGAMRVG